MDLPAPRRRATAFAVAICAVVYLFLFPYQPGLNNPNENIRLYMTAALVEEGRFEIDEMRRRWGWTNDAACVDRDAEGEASPCDGGVPAGSTRHFYSVKAPLTSYLGMPGYALYYAFVDDEPDEATALWICRVSGTVIPWLIFLWFFHRWLGQRTRHPALRDAVFLTVALGSALFGYTLMFASHTTAAVFAFGGFMILYDARRRRKLSAFGAALAGLLVSGASALEYPCVFVSAILCVYALSALSPFHRIVPFVLGALIPVILLMHFQGAAFGNPFSPGHLFVENPAFRAGHHEGLFGAETFHVNGAISLLFHRRLGMFALSPLLFLGVPGLVWLVFRRGRRADALAALSGIVVLYVFVCHLNVWHAGWSVGPRYLTALIPFLGWGTLEVLDAAARRRPGITAGVALGATAAAFVAGGIPSAYYPHIPPQFEHPMAHLFSVLIAHDFAPYNAANLVGWYGTSSMVLPALLMLVALVLAFLHLRGRPARVTAVIVAAIFTAGLLAPHFAVREPTIEERYAVGFVASHWSPAGHDRASRLAEELAESDAPSAADYERLADYYYRQGEHAREVEALRRATAISEAPE